MPPDQPTDDDNDMGVYELNTHPFIIKIWLEEAAIKGSRAIWRGHITHVPSGERRYLKKLDDIIDFIIPYMEQMGIKIALCVRLKQWFKRNR